VIDLQREDLLRVLQKDKATARFKVDDVVELAPGAQIERNAAGLKFGDPGRVIEVDVESEIHAVRIVMKNGKKKWYKADDLVPCSRSFNLEKDNYAFIRTRLEWLNKDFGEMTEDEMRCVTLLSAMEDWVTDRRLRVRDVFGMIDQDASGNLGPEEILKGVDFMGLENPPDVDMCQKVLILIDADGSGEVDMAELDSVLMAIRERKARHRKADNFFLKQPSEMNGVELAAEEFFVPLVAKLDARSWGAVEFFAHFDADESGSLDVEEFLTAGETLGIVVNSIDMFKRCCILVDPNIDGSLGIGELNRVIAMVREALRARDQEAQDAKNPFLALAPTNPSGPKMVKIFGRKAFLECLLKIAFAYLSFHGSGLQAELPTHSKALWLLGYLNWQFRRHKAEHRMIAKMQSQTELGNLNKKAAATTTSMKMKGGQQLANSTTMSMNTASLRDLGTGALTSGTSSEAKSTAPEEPKEPEVSRRMGAVDNAMWGKLQSMARQSIRRDGGGGQSRGFSTVLKGLHAQGLRERLAEREANDDFQNRKNARGSTSQENDDESEDEEEEDDGPEPEVRPGSSVRFSEAEVVKVEDLSSSADNEGQLEPSAEENPQEQGKMQPPAQAASTSKLQVPPTSKLQAPPSLSTSKLQSPLSKLASVPEGQTSLGSSNSLSTSKLQSPPSKLKPVPEAQTSPGDSEEATASQALRTRKKAAEKEADAKRLAGAGRRGLLKLQSVVKQKKFAKYLPPLKRLIVQSPEIFVHAPNLPPGGAVTMETACSACGIPPSQGWGNSFCSQCGHADAILWQCIGKTEGPGPATLPVFDRIIIDFGVDNNGHGHGRHTTEAGH